ncbi:hypothetical protein TNCV_2722771 [Trichonephila clavipes]|nr:hypothetical protein TNCV_2722771 [Trichonephila clavipes]
MTSGLPPLFPSRNHTRGLAARRLFRVPPCRERTIHLQTFNSSSGFEPSSYDTAVSVTNHYTGWAAAICIKFAVNVYFVLFDEEFRL